MFQTLVSGTINRKTSLCNAVKEAGNRYIVIIDEWDAPIRESVGCRGHRGLEELSAEIEKIPEIALTLG